MCVTVGPATSFLLKNRRNVPELFLLKNKKKNIARIIPSYSFYLKLLSDVVLSKFLLVDWRRNLNSYWWSDDENLHRRKEVPRKCLDSFPSKEGERFPSLTPFLYNPESTPAVSGRLNPYPNFSSLLRFLGMEDMVEARAPDFPCDLDFDYLLEGFSDDPALDLSAGLWNSEPSPDESKSEGSVNSGPSTEPFIPDPPPEQSGSPDSMPSFVNEIEKFLMEDAEGGEDVIDDEFLAGFFSDVSADSRKSEVASPEAEQVLAVVESEAKEKREASAVVDVEDDDPISKKRRRYE